MSENFFLDNSDLQFRLAQLDLREVVNLKEENYRHAEAFPAAPRNYPDAKDNYRLLLEVLGDICAKIVAPRAAEADEEGAQLEDGEVRYAAATQAAIDAFKQAGVMGAMLPWQYGGLNLPETIYQMMVEIVSRAEGGLMTIFGLQEIAASINEFGDEAMKAEILPRFAQGGVAGAMVLTEPDAGSDLGAVQMRAIWDEGAGVWRLNGVKRFITNGNAEISLVLARTEPDTADARGLSIFLVERDETVRIRRLEHKLGIHSSPTCELQYTHTPARLVGKRRFGLIRYSMALMNGARLAVSAQALGIAEAAYREAYRYANERAQFGQPIIALPAVTRMLLSMRGEIEATRALLGETGRWVDLFKGYEHQSQSGATDPALRQKLKQAGSLADTLTPLSKYYATEMGNRVCYQAMQVHGGVGYMREFNVERHYRDVRITNIYEGTTQLQVVGVIGKLLAHTLEALFEPWAARDYGAALADMKARVLEATALFRQGVDALKTKDRAVIDYYASDLVEMAVHTVNFWLLLQDACVSERKCAVARVYVAEHLPRLRGMLAALLAADPAPLEAGRAMLAV